MRVNYITVKTKEELIADGAVMIDGKGLLVDIIIMKEDRREDTLGARVNVHSEKSEKDGIQDGYLAGGRYFTVASKFNKGLIPALAVSKVEYTDDNGKPQECTGEEYIDLVSWE